MNTISSLLLLAFIIVANAGSKTDHEATASDLVEALTFLQCAQKALKTGIPEAGIPSYDPLVFTQNVSFNYTFLSSRVNIDLTNMSMKGIPQWTITQAQQILNDDPNIDIFKFNFNWPAMSFYTNWLYVAQKPDVKYIVRGTLNMELSNVDFTIGWTSTKAGSERNGTLDEFTLDVITEKARVTVTNLALLDYLINIIGGPALAYFVNHNPLAGALSQLIKVIIIEDWINKPDKIDAVNANC